MNARDSPYLHPRVGLAAYGQNPVFRWVQELGGSDGQTVAGIRADSQGNTYIAGTAASVTFATTHALQAHPASSGLFRIDGPGAAWRNLYGSGAASVYALASSPQAPDTIYAVTDQALIRSMDAGKTWSPVPGAPASLRAIAVDPFNVRLLYAGAYGSGLFKSTDAGMSWAAINHGLQPSAGGKLYPLNVWPDPNFPGVLFAAINTGLARSSDSGATWLYPPPSPYGFGLSFDPFSPGAIYVAILADPVHKASSTRPHIPDYLSVAKRRVLEQQALRAGDIPSRRSLHRIN